MKKLCFLLGLILFLFCSQAKDEAKKITPEFAEHTINEDDTLVTADSLRKVIDLWQGFIQKKPTDPNVDFAYMQIASGCLLLTKITRDSSNARTGLDLIANYYNLATQRDVKEKLNEKFVELQSLRFKPPSKVWGVQTATLNIGSLGSEIIDSYFTYGLVNIPDLEYKGDKLETDSLKNIIDFWKRFIKEKPKDSFAEWAYVQIATGYYLLAEKTKDRSLIKEGIKQAKRHLNLSEDEKARQKLKEKIEQLEALKLE